MSTTITAEELKDHVAEILDRVETHGESFDIERNGHVIARIAASYPLGGKTLDQILAGLGDLRMPDPDFAEDLEEIHNS